ncbi:MAG: response regulator [Planctomycetota bacterium]
MHSVLVVEDEGYFRKAMVERLRTDGLKVGSVESPDAAIEFLRTNAVDVVVVDMFFPGIRTGLDVVRHCKERLPHIRTLVVSGAVSIKDSTNIIREGVTELILKPVDLGDVSGSVQKVLQRVEEDRRERDRLVALSSEKQSLERKVQDRTQELEYALRRLRKMDLTREKFMNLVSHVFRTPLTAVVATLELFYESQENEDDRNLLSAAVSEAWHLHRICEDILRVTRISADLEERRKVPVNFFELAETSIRTFSDVLSDKPVQWRNLVPTGLRVTADPGVGEAFFRVLENAVQHTTEGEIVVWMTESRNNATLCLRDTGCGIAAEDLEILMDPFELKTPIENVGVQTGLGLAVADALMQVVGGRIWLESEGAGKGTIAFLEFPISRPEDGESDSATVSASS